MGQIVIRKRAQLGEAKLLPCLLYQLPHSVPELRTLPRGNVESGGTSCLKTAAREGKKIALKANGRANRFQSVNMFLFAFVFCGAFRLDRFNQIQRRRVYVTIDIYF